MGAALKVGAGELSDVKLARLTLIDSCVKRLIRENQKALGDILTLEELNMPFDPQARIDGFLKGNGHPEGANMLTTREIKYIAAQVVLALDTPPGFEEVDDTLQEFTLY